MAYDHARKAGNRGDVWKHAVLVALTDAITTDSSSFRYVESHAGAPLHDLKPGGALGGAEAERVRVVAELVEVVHPRAPRPAQAVRRPRTSIR